LIFSCLIFIGNVSSVSGQLYKPVQPVRLDWTGLVKVRPLKKYNWTCIFDYTTGKISENSGVKSWQNRIERKREGWSVKLAE
jgi:hypothetical protein